MGSSGLCGEICLQTKTGSEMAAVRLESPWSIVTELNRLNVHKARGREGGGDSGQRMRREPSCCRSKGRSGT